MTTNAWPDYTEPTPMECDLLTTYANEQHANIGSAIDREVALLNDQIAQARGYAAEAAIAAEFSRAFPPQEAGYSHQMRATVGVGAHALNGVLVMWDARKLSDVTPRVKWLAEKLGKFEIEDYAELGRRTYNFGRFKFCVFFNTFNPGTVCKFVEVGKEEKPVFKLMCGEDAEAAS